MKTFLFFCLDSFCFSFTFICVNLPSWHSSCLLACVTKMKNKSVLNCQVPGLNEMMMTKTKIEPKVNSINTTHHLGSIVLSTALTLVSQSHSFLPQTARITIKWDAPVAPFYVSISIWTCWNGEYYVKAARRHLNDAKQYGWRQSDCFPIQFHSE